MPQVQAMTVQAKDIAISVTSASPRVPGPAAARCSQCLGQSTWPDSPQREKQAPGQPVPHEAEQVARTLAKAPAQQHEDQR